MGGKRKHITENGTQNRYFRDADFVDTFPLIIVAVSCFFYFVLFNLKEARLFFSV